MARIIIADDHAIVRQGLKMILDEYYDLNVMQEASSGDELLDKLQQDTYDLVILDISMPGRDAIDTLKEIREYYPTLPVLILSLNPEKLYAMRLLKLGASGYVNKQCQQDELVEAIRKVANGGKYISPELSEILASYVGTGIEKPLHETLTDREFQIMCMIAEGKTPDEISEKLFLSKNTVSNHRNNIMKKLNLRNNSEITLYAMKNNLLK